MYTHAHCARSGQKKKGRHIYTHISKGLCWAKWKGSYSVTADMMGVDQVTCWCECLRVSHHDSVCVWLGFLLLTPKHLSSHVRDPQSSLQVTGQTPHRSIKASKQLAFTQACRKTLSRVIIDDSDRTPEGSCHGHRQAGTSHRFHTVVVHDFETLKSIDIALSQMWVNA